MFRTAMTVLSSKSSSHWICDRAYGSRCLATFAIRLSPVISGI
jgi:hypothetical protein